MAFFNEEDKTAAILKGPEAIRKLMTDGKEASVAIMREVNSLAEPHIPNDGADWEYTVGFFWDCEQSPFGLCMYHRFEDRAHDNCVFCHEPEERK